MSDSEKFQIIIRVNIIETALNEFTSKVLKTEGKESAEHEYLKVVENIAPANLSVNVLTCHTQKQNELQIM